MSKDTRIDFAVEMYTFFENILSEYVGLSKIMICTASISLIES